MSQLPVVASKNGLKVLVVDANNKNKVFDITNLLLSSEFQQALSEHNTSATAHEDLRELVEGRYNALTFLDEAQLVSWINGTYTRDDEVLVGDLVKGQNIYLMSKDEPDYWVSSLPVVGSTIETMSGLTELQTDKVDLEGYQKLLTAAPNGNIIIDQTTKCVSLAQGLKDITSIQGITGGTFLNIFCDENYQRAPEIYLSKDLIRFKATGLSFLSDTTERLRLDSSGVKISSPSGVGVLEVNSSFFKLRQSNGFEVLNVTDSEVALNNSGGSTVFKATDNTIEIFDSSLHPVLARRNDGSFMLLNKKNGSINPVLYNSVTGEFIINKITSTSSSQIVYSTDSLIKYFDNANRDFLVISDVSAGQSLAFYRGPAKPIITFDPATNVFTLFGNGNTTPCKIIEQTADTSMVYYSIGGVALLTITRSGGNLGYAPNHEFARAMYKEIAFTGTQAQWDALTAAQKSNYEHVSIID